MEGHELTVLQRAVGVLRRIGGLEGWGTTVPEIAEDPTQWTWQQRVAASWALNTLAAWVADKSWAFLDEEKEPSLRKAFEAYMPRA